MQVILFAVSRVVLSPGRLIGRTNLWCAERNHEDVRPKTVPQGCKSAIGLRATSEEDRLACSMPD